MPSSNYRCIPVGFKVNRLSFLREFKGTKRRMAVCLCDCGKIVTLDKGNFLYGSQKSCGCARFIDGHGHAYKKMEIGEKRGRLTFIKAAPSLGKITRISCRCDCGKEIVIRKESFRQGHTKSCGCLRVDTTRKLRRNLLPEGQSSINSLFKLYVRGASERHLDFELSMEDFKAITSQPCIYCGVPPANKTHWKKRNGVYTFNGIDRVDNNVGYVAGNVVSCCKMCQYAKRDNSVVEFLTWAVRLAKHQRKYPFKHLNYEDGESRH